MTAPEEHSTKLKHDYEIRVQGEVMAQCTHRDTVSIHGFHVCMHLELRNSVENGLLKL
jgi:hypothetical protein